MIPRAELEHAAREIENAPPEEVLRWATAAYPPGKLAVSSAFGPGSIVLIHMLAEMAIRLPIIFVDTLHHFPETLEHVERVRQRYDLDLRVVRPAPSLEAFESQHGARLWERDVERYQRVAKVEPFRRATSGLDAWITGRRRDQSKSRAAMPIVEAGEGTRINPLARWSRARLWCFIVEHGLPYNPLHDRDYWSIGDAPLTTRVGPGEDERAGRWRGFDRLECGIHDFNQSQQPTGEKKMSNQLQSIELRGYAVPDVLVCTGWVAEHLNDPAVRIVESDEDVLLYDSGHIPGAVKVDWHADLNDPLIRDYLDPGSFAELMSRKGITPETTVVFYGDKNNWWATYALWVFHLFGHDRVRVMDGGRKKWEDEGRPFTTDVPSYPPADYPVPTRDDSRVRAFLKDVRQHLERQGQLIDVRSPEEFRGEKLHMPDYPQEGAMRGGHIPGAQNVPWARAVNPDTGEFLSAEALRRIYERETALSPSSPTITYCRIGERSSHTWFVLRYLLGHQDVRNYDGSWTEWGNSVRVPIER